MENDLGADEQKLSLLGRNFEDLVRVVTILFTGCASCFYLLLCGFLDELSVPYTPTLFESVQFFVISFAQRIFVWERLIFLSFFVNFGVVYLLRKKNFWVTLNALIPRVDSGLLKEVLSYESEVTKESGQLYPEKYFELVKRTKNIALETNVFSIRMVASFILPAIIMFIFAGPLLISVFPVIVLIVVLILFDDIFAIYRKMKMDLGVPIQMAVCLSFLALLGTWSIPYNMGRELALPQGKDPQAHFPMNYTSKGYEEAGFLLWKSGNLSYFFICESKFSARIKEFKDGKVLTHSSGNRKQYEFFCGPEKAM